MTKFGIVKRASSVGPLSIAVPGELKCFEYVHKKYGKLEWASLFKPTILLAQNGFEIDSALYNDLKTETETLLSFPTFRETYFDSKGNPLPVGTIIKRPDFAATLQTLSDEGVQSFYNGSLREKIFNDFRNSNFTFIINEQDFENYSIETFDQPLSSFYQGYQLLFPPPPFSTVVNAMALNILER